MDSDSTPQSAQTAAPSPAPAKPYVAPAIIWEQEFVALAQASDPVCVPGRDPACTP